MRRFEELDWQETPMGPISLRRRQDAVLGVVFEAKLGEEFLMSSAFTASESELSRQGLAMLEGDALTVLVGGLGLGYTAVTALEDPRVAAVTVVEALEPVIGWHRAGLLPMSERLVGDARTRLTHADFFAVVAGRAEAGGVSGEEFDAVLLDVDHTPDHLLDPSHGPFYTVEGLTRMRTHLKPGGVLGVWSDDPPADAFLRLLEQVYVDVSGRVVSFANPLTGGESACTVYLARRPRLNGRAQPPGSAG